MYGFLKCSAVIGLEYCKFFGVPDIAGLASDVQWVDVAGGLLMYFVVAML